MASERRIEKLNMVLREELARIIDRELEFSEGALVTITRVDISKDMYYAGVFFSVFGGNPEDAGTVFQKNIYAIQQALNKRLRIRPVPKIHFSLDRGEEHREGVERVISESKRKEKF